MTPGTAGPGALGAGDVDGVTEEQAATASAA